MDPLRLTLPLPPSEPLDLDATLRGGQVFRWRRHGDAWYGPYRSGSLSVRPRAGGLEVAALGVSIGHAEAARFLGLNPPLQQVYGALGADRWTAAAARAVPGLRLMRQEPWECLAAFICSQNSNIPKIELSLERISRTWGTIHRWPGGIDVASFPPPEVLAGLSVDELWPCAAGYRCRYLIEAARQVARGEVELDALRRAGYADALAALLRLHGVGRKVADCVLLFALDRPDAVPVDVWVRRVTHELYGRELAEYLPDAAERSGKPLLPREYEAIRRFFTERWGEHAGYAQQYLFHARRLGLLRGG
jgi:N-glycosylase/DNA lyase